MLGNDVKNNDFDGLSILIPTYDYTCYKLVYDLHEQAEALGIAYEIIVGEDGSKSPSNHNCQSQDNGLVKLHPSYP